MVYLEQFAQGATAKTLTEEQLERFINSLIKREGSEY